jgi:hypothetical protein
MSRLGAPVAVIPLLGESQTEVPYLLCSSVGYTQYSCTNEFDFVLGMPHLV